MNIHVDIVHPKLFVQGKVQLAKKVDGGKKEWAL